ncbi:MAG: class I SAM-dependent methyltransferase, partial [Candidatus Parcubacteria bacterium]|nr:class I SAM-dependent methyltransferase [Candidatus Parcubacteria bacterium]
GSGIATVELAKFGCHVVALEPGAKLAEIAKKQTENFKNVDVQVGTFEDFQSPTKFDAVLAFTAFHWLTEGEKYSKVLDLLKDSGSLVLVWNSFFQSDSPATRAVNQAYVEFLPDIYPDESVVAEVNQGVLAKLNGREQDVVKNPQVYTIGLRKYLSTYHYDRETYPKLLNTFPKIVEVDEDRRQKFLTHIAEIVEKYGQISVPVLTTLIICKKRSSFLKLISKK